MEKSFQLQVLLRTLLPALVFCGSCKQVTESQLRQLPVVNIQRKPAGSLTLDFLDGLLENSAEFSVADVIIPRVEEWFVQNPFDPDFSTVANASSIFADLAKYVVESEKRFSPSSSMIYSSNDNVTTVEFPPISSYPGIEVK
jgi:hypothetical protein